MTEEVACSFCFKTRDEVLVLVKSTDKDKKIVAICDECVADAEEILKEPFEDLVS